MGQSSTKKYNSDRSSLIVESVIWSIKSNRRGILYNEEYLLPYTHPNYSEIYEMVNLRCFYSIYFLPNKRYAEISSVQVLLFPATIRNTVKLKDGDTYEGRYRELIFDPHPFNYYEWQFRALVLRDQVLRYGVPCKLKVKVTRLDPRRVIVEKI